MVVVRACRCSSQVLELRMSNSVFGATAPVGQTLMQFPQ